MGTVRRRAFSTCFMGQASRSRSSLSAFLGSRVKERDKNTKKEKLPTPYTSKWDKQVRKRKWSRYQASSRDLTFFGCHHLPRRASSPLLYVAAHDSWALAMRLIIRKALSPFSCALSLYLSVEDAKSKAKSSSGTSYRIRSKVGS